MENSKFELIIKSRRTTAEQLEDLYAYENLSVEQIAELIKHCNTDPDFIEEILYEEDLDYTIVYAIAGKAQVLSQEAIEKLLYIILHDHPLNWTEKELKRLFGKLKHYAAKRDGAYYEYPWLDMDLKQFIDEYGCGDREIFSDDETDYAE